VEWSGRGAEGLDLLRRPPSCRDLSLCTRLELYRPSFPAGHAAPVTTTNRPFNNAYGAGAGGAGGDVRPLGVEEAKRQAAAALALDRNVRAVKAAASAAASVLAHGP
jgi:hypothetical protein